MSGMKAIHARIAAGVSRMQSWHEAKRLGRKWVDKETIYNPQVITIHRAVLEDPVLRHFDRMLWLQMHTYAHRRTSKDVWPSVGRLCKDMKVTPPTIHNSFDILEASGWLYINRKVRGFHGKIIGNCFFINDKPARPDTNTLTCMAVERMAAMSGPTKQPVVRVAKEIMRGPDKATSAPITDIPLRRKAESAAPARDGTSLAHHELDNSTNVALDWPEVLQENKAPALHILKKAPAQQQQSILDALAAASNVRNPLGYLSSLAAAARDGKFVPSDIEVSENEDSKALSSALDKARAAINDGKRVTICGCVIEDITDNNLIKRRDKARYFQVFGLGIRDKDIDIHDSG